MCIRKSRKVLILGSDTDVEASIGLVSKNSRYSCSYAYVNDMEIESIYKLIISTDEVLICPNMENELKEMLINLCTEAGKPVLLVPKVYELSLVGASVCHCDDLLVLRMGSTWLSARKAFVKRLFDIIAAVIGVILTLPIMLCASAAIKLCDGGPVLFPQERVTKGGKKFILYKFRTMVVDAEKHTGPVLALENDKRITTVGRILRSIRLDELPQLFNVIKGDMSIVGPRPERPFFEKKITETIPEFKYRLAVKAGITGMAQIHSKYSTTPENKLRFDMLYIKNYSIWLDIKIIMLTLGVIFKKDYSEGVNSKENITLNRKSIWMYDAKRRIYHDKGL